MIPRHLRETLLERFPVMDRSAIDKILSDNIQLPGPYQQHGCIFIHVPKCAGTSIKRTLFPGHTLGHTPLWYYERNYPEFYGKAFKFSFVRHPVDRAFSAYRYLRANRNCVERNSPAHRMVMRYASFDQFIQNWLCEETALRQIHFVPQWRFITDSLGDMRMDFIGRHETMRQDFETICAKLGVAADLKQMNETPNENVDGGFETRTLDRLYRVYERDFALLGYEEKP